MTTTSAPPPIFAAVESGDVAGVRRLLAADPSAAAARNNAGLPVLLFARYRGAMEIVALLLAAGWPLDVFEAAATGHDARVAELLAASSALALAYGSDGFTALQLASFFGQTGAARVLLDAGAEVNAVAHNGFQIMPLHSACAGQHYELVELLLARGAEVNARQQGGFTPLHAATQHGDRRLAEMLLAHGADPAVANDAGKTSIDLAQEGGHEDLLPLFHEPR